MDITLGIFIIVTTIVLWFVPTVMIIRDMGIDDYLASPWILADIIFFSFIGFLASVIFSGE